MIGIMVLLCVPDFLYIFANSSISVSSLFLLHLICTEDTKDQEEADNAEGGKHNLLAACQNMSELNI